MKQIMYLGGKKARGYDGVDEPSFGLWISSPAAYEQEMKEYQSHISTLPVFDVIGDFDWKNYEVKTEGVDYTEQFQFLLITIGQNTRNEWVEANLTNSEEYYSSEGYQTRTVIVPIPKKQEGEEELWKAAEAEFIKQADIANYDISVITDTPYFRWLKRNFTITRKS